MFSQHSGLALVLGSEEDSNEFIGIISAMLASLRGDIQNVGYQSINRGSV